MMVQLISTFPSSHFFSFIQSSFSPLKKCCERTKEDGEMLHESECNEGILQNIHSSIKNEVLSGSSHSGDSSREHSSLENKNKKNHFLIKESISSVQFIESSSSSSSSSSFFIPLLFLRYLFGQ